MMKKSCIGSLKKFFYFLFFTLIFILFSVPSAIADPKLVVIGSGSEDTVKIVGSDRTNQYSDLHLYKEDYWSVNFFDVYSSLNKNHAPYFNLRRARGTMDSPTSVQDGDQAVRHQDGRREGLRAPNAMSPQSTQRSPSKEGT